MINFNIPPFTGKETEYMKQAVDAGKISGDGMFTKKCAGWMKERFAVKEALLTTSCTHALEMAAFLCDLKPGDEVIMPSYTFVSTADAFVLQGAKIVFVDVHPETMNIDETKIEAAITERTKVIVPGFHSGCSPLRASALPVHIPGRRPEAYRKAAHPSKPVRYLRSQLRSGD